MLSWHVNRIDTRRWGLMDMYFRVNNYRHGIKSMDLCNSIFLEQHFRSNGHNFNTEVKSTMSERIVKHIRIKSMTEKSMIEKANKEAKKQKIKIRDKWINNQQKKKNGGIRGYRRREWTRRHEFKSWTRLIAFHIALIP